MVAGMKNVDLNKAKEELLAAINEAGLAIFPGAYPSEETPEIPWEPAVEPNPNRIVQIAKSLGVKVLCVSWDHFTQQELDHALIEQIGQADVAAFAYNQALLVFRQFVGQLGSIRAGFFHEGAFYVMDIDAEWYWEFETLAMLGAPPETDDADWDDDEISVPGEWAEPQGPGLAFDQLARRGRKKTGYPKNASARGYKPRSDEVVLDADKQPALPDESVAKRSKKRTH
jgi:hypothetical protein